MKVAAPPSYDVAMQTQQTAVALSPPTGEPVSLVMSSASETDPPSYHAAQEIETPTLSSTNQGSLDDADEIQVDAAIASALQSNRDQ